jgi:putative ABC transport system ATP-binding protein
MQTTQQSRSPIVHIEGLSKQYESPGGAPVAVFAHVNLVLHAGETVAIVGESGVGKSTLLNCMGGLDDATGGSISVCGAHLASLNADQRALLRRERIGFVFQAFHVLPHLDVAGNVGLPLMLLGRPAREREAAVAQALDAVGLNGLGARLPAQLSGGQLQRVAIARAFLHRPALILADEPTGNLDPDTAARVLDVLLAQAQQNGSALVLVTHSSAAAQRLGRTLHLTREGLHG